MSEPTSETPAASGIRIETASATAEETAVIVALLSAMGGDDAEPPARSHWASPAGMMRPMMRPVHDGWRFSGFAH